MPRYLTRFKLRLKKPLLMKLAKAAVASIDELIDGYQSEYDEKILEKVNRYLKDEAEKENEKRARIMKELKRYLKQEEPGETDDEEDIQEEEEIEKEDVEEGGIREDYEVHEERGKNLEDEEVLEKIEENQEEENVAEGEEEEIEEENVEEREIREDDKVLEEKKENPNEDENVIGGEEVDEGDSLFDREMDSIENVIRNISLQYSEEKSDQMSEISLVDLLADHSVTAPDGTFNALLKGFGPRSGRSTSLFDLGSKKSNSLASLRTAAVPTPLSTVGSVSEQSLFVEKTLRRRARRSSQDLAHHFLYNDRMASSLGHVSIPNSNFATPASASSSVICLETLNQNSGFLSPRIVDSSVICLGTFNRYSGLVTPTAVDESVICLGTVKKPTPPIVTIGETPKRRKMFHIEQTTPQVQVEFLKIRASLRRVPDSPMAKEMREMTEASYVMNSDSQIHGGSTDRHVTDMEISPIQALTTERLFSNMNSPIYGGTTDRHVTDMEISPVLAGTTDRHITDMEISPIGKSSSSELEDLPLIPQNPRLRNRRMTPFPEELHWKM